MSNLNHDADKDIVVDVSSDIIVDVSSDGEEIELIFEKITNRSLAPKRYVYNLPKDHYEASQEDKSPKK